MGLMGWLAGPEGPQVQKHVLVSVVFLSWPSSFALRDAAAMLLQAAHVAGWDRLATIYTRAAAVALRFTHNRNAP
ncbi:hypothetical protein CS8_004140 [Cupriavidus sp. 8B]